MKNQHIIRTTIEALPNLDPTETFILIGWRSWEPDCWAHDPYIPSGFSESNGHKKDYLWHFGQSAHDDYVQ